VQDGLSRITKQSVQLSRIDTRAGEELIPISSRRKPRCVGKPRNWLAPSFRFVTSDPDEGLRTDQIENPTRELSHSRRCHLLRMHRPMRRAIPESLRWIRFFSPRSRLPRGPSFADSAACQGSVTASRSRAMTHSNVPVGPAGMRRRWLSHWRIASTEKPKRFPGSPSCASVAAWRAMSSFRDSSKASF
jgi:hypothetical protein